ncbi:MULTISPECIES: sigma-54-dependent transcriptional regulator [Stigmatella]|uniref:DNA-binding transcriptional response regulator, NtrC family, contains REC, AAA-type ATPase, and a Fis-type DNA-binding domains n=2 Tax=Stigmatella TaxID=40 RepID=A0A1H7TVP5_STIAU|nr:MULTISPECIES: sigma-54 dependent transcriptional regulator [Stigmatella]SEL88589.1 DNA-binding transcriptional response regulator, NtrC family, contains REC, AAA-type ATPase, and a Fis-type DNA-binding domains [Stigmatella aurantiaca]SET90119.1 DNA-binding transcriptional response regulator, NtrC family, contains REC, AAA-type ATPase, and a Fis-type DNA-binding domains [Stigmatella erecta]
MSPARILAVDDDPHARDLLRRLLGTLGEVLQAAHPEGAIERLTEDGPFDLVLTDMAMPNPGDGLRVLKEVKTRLPDTPVIVVTAFGNVEGALDSIQQGAFDYLAKPFDVDAIMRVARRALEQKRLVEENRSLRKQVERSTLVGRSPALLEVYKQVARAATSNVPVLITGETGTGKEMVARSLHKRSPRASGPFIPVDCGAIAESLMESELFGHSRGAFTGATGARRGLFEEASGGTLFLDEIGDVGLKVQSQLLRVLQEGEIRRVGESAPVKVDVRVVAATNKELQARVAEGLFREDLLYRLDVVHLRLPPLRERREDITAMVEHFAALHARGGVRPVVTPEAVARLTAYEWPGNVRQLENVVARALALNVTGVLGPQDFPEPIGDAPKKLTGLAEDMPSLAELSRRYAAQVLQHVGGNKSEAARLLGVDRKTLYKLLEAAEPEAT